MIGEVFEKIIVVELLVEYFVGVCSDLVQLEDLFGDVYVYDCWFYLCFFG